MTENTKHVSYTDAGVNVDEGARAVELIKADVATTRRPEVIGGLGGFGCLFSGKVMKEMEEPVLVSGTDGVGTKLAIAQLLGRNETVGQDLVAMCVDDIAPAGAEPLFFLDYVAIGKLEPERVQKIVSGIAEGCRLSGCALIGGEMAEHPGVMKTHDYDLAGFCVGVVDRPKMLGPQLVHEGDVILGLPSSLVATRPWVRTSWPCAWTTSLRPVPSRCSSWITWRLASSRPSACKRLSPALPRVVVCPVARSSAARWPSTPAS